MKKYVYTKKAEVDGIGAAGVEATPASDSEEAYLVLHGYVYTEEVGTVPPPAPDAAIRRGAMKNADVLEPENDGMVRTERARKGARRG